MQELNLYRLFTDRLNDKKIHYAITGSVAAIIYGEPRMTHDIDLVIQVDSSKVEDLVNAFPDNEFYCPPVEVIKIEILKTSRGHCNIIHRETGFKADVYFTGKDAFQLWAIEGSKNFDLENTQITVAPVEYVIIKKLEFYREGLSQKHIEDIKAIILNSKELIDFSLLLQHIKGAGLMKEWELCSK